jgi:hypothetical protein
MPSAAGRESKELIGAAAADNLLEGVGSGQVAHIGREVEGSAL